MVPSLKKGLKSLDVMRRLQKFENISHFFWRYILSKFQKRWDMFSNSVAFSQYLNFKEKIEGLSYGSSFWRLDQIENTFWD